MSQRKIKAYRGVAKSTMRKEYKKYIYSSLDRLCREPLKERLHFLWLILCKKNPHTGKKVTNG